MICLAIPRTLSTKSSHKTSGEAHPLPELVYKWSPLLRAVVSARVRAAALGQRHSAERDDRAKLENQVERFRE
jgi:hypothetical protein